MNTPARPPLKSTTNTPTGPAAAEQAGPLAAEGARRVAAEGVLSALRPDPRCGDGRRPVAWLHITAPGRGAIPTATSKCACGRDRSAVGHRRVLDLIKQHADHRTTCPLRAPQEGRAAA